MTDTVKSFVNAIQDSVAAEIDTPLSYILRDDLKVMGTSFRCELGQCGACNVLIEGRNGQSCDTPLWAVVGKRITTIEGLGAPGRLHPLQQAFIDAQAAQCGYCVNGIIISAKALLDGNPHPNEDEIRAALDRNLCRCGTHNRFIRAIRNVARKANGGTPL